MYLLVKHPASLFYGWTFYGRVEKPKQNANNLFFLPFENCIPSNWISLEIALIGSYQMAWSLYSEFIPICSTCHTQVIHTQQISCIFLCQFNGKRKGEREWTKWGCNCIGKFSFENHRIKPNWQRKKSHRNEIRYRILFFSFISCHRHAFIHWALCGSKFDALPKIFAATK